MTAVLIDLDLGNLRSVWRAFRYIGADLEVVDHPDAIKSASAIILPGVGAFRDGMAAMQRKGLVAPLQNYARTAQKPLLGICLGMQLLTTSSEEFGNCEGLDLVPGRVVRLDPQKTRGRVPNIGWCDVQSIGTQKHAQYFSFESSLFERTFYFAHSYHLQCDCSDSVIATLDFGGQPITAAIAQGNLFGVQFHPEKSQDAGLALLEAFWQLIRNHMT